MHVVASGMRHHELENLLHESSPSEITIFGEDKFKEDPLEVQKPVINYVDAFTNGNVPMLCIAADSTPSSLQNKSKPPKSQLIECVGDKVHQRRQRHFRRKHR